jgi:vancomycin resistance protein YoaR
MKKKNFKLILISFLVILIITPFLLYLFFENKFENKVYPNIYFNEFNLEGLTEEEVEELIREEIYEFDLEGFEIKHKDREFLWKRDSFSSDPDLRVQSVNFDTNTASEEAISLGRSGYFFEDLRFKIDSFNKKTELNLPYEIDKNKIIKDIEEVFFDDIDIAEDAKLVSNVLPTGEIEFSVEKESYGEILNRDLFFSQLEENIRNLDSDDIYLKFSESEPEIKKEEAESFKDNAYDVLSLAPFNLKYLDNGEEEFFEISKETFSNWLKIEKDSEGELKFSLSYKQISDFFDEEIAPKVNKEKIDPQFEFEDNRVSVFYPGQDGLILDYEKSFSNLLDFFLMREMDNIFLEFAVDEVSKVDSVNNLGIKEIIGVGHSNFAGSSASRKHNIKVGKDKFTGLIIAPDEEFSFVNYLGEVNAETGYLPELVIKGDKTIPEYGGGLCQVSTTMFRTALNTGLPITARSNHSYRVSYYEPAGTDATIYDPWPDLKFKNDTGNNILIQSKIEGNDFYFYFWGTSDDRKVEVTDPVIYNIVSPGPTKIIETTDLEPGEEKCTERAINGASAYFDYKVTYNPGTEEENIVEERIHSKYVPWTAVCLVGVEEEEKEEELEEEIVEEEKNEE